MARKDDWISRGEMAQPRSKRLAIAHEGRTRRVGMDSRADASSYRMRGRRGVRARRRAYRIAERQYNGTYKQPGGGTGTNS